MARSRLRMFDDCTVVEWSGLILLLLLAVTMAIPWGAILPAGTVRLQIGAFATAALAAFARRRSIGAAAGPVILILLLCLIGALQLVPIEPATLARLAPSNASIYAETNRILSLFGERGATPRISIAPSETMRATLLIAAYVALFVASTVLLRHRWQRRAAIVAIVASAVVQIAWAATTQGQEDRTHGLFVNPNHFAGYLEIVLAMAFALLWTEILTGRERVGDVTDNAARVEGRLVPLAWRLLAWIVIAAGIALTKSRMGIAAAMLTTLMLVAAVSIRRRGRSARYAAAIGGAMAAALAMVAVITREVPILRFLASDPRDPDSDVRFRLWQLSLDAWSLFPTFGSGLGTYREAFKRVQPSTFPGLYEQAHNDALQLLVTGGWISLALAAVALAWIFTLLVRGWLRQRHREESAIALASAAALFSLVIHGIVEFNFSVPAIPATLAIVLGCGWAAARHKSPRQP